MTLGTASSEDEAHRIAILGVVCIVNFLEKFLGLSQRQSIRICRVLLEDSRGDIFLKITVFMLATRMGKVELLRRRFLPLPKPS